MVIEQISVWNTLSGDGKIHHVIIKPDNKLSQDRNPNDVIEKPNKK